MTDTKTSALTALTGANVDPAADLLPIVDTSATTTKKITAQEFYNSAQTLTAIDAVALDDLLNTIDFSASSVAKKATVQQTLNAANLLTDIVALAAGDKVPVIDVSASNVAKSATMTEVATYLFSLLGISNVGSGTVQTTDATQTTAATFTPDDGDAIAFGAHVIGRRADGGAVAHYELSALFRRAGGTITQVSTTVVVVVREDTGALDATLDASGTGIRIRVTGIAATTYDWSYSYQVRSYP